MAMFPLGSVLFPGAVLPLQVFEERYRTMISDIETTDNRFGVVLISRGRDVGGGDERTDIGTIAEIVRKGEAEDGRILITAVGRSRIQVAEWLEDDPYPQAQVEELPDDVAPDGIGSALKAAAAARRRLLALAIEMGADGQQLDIDLPEDPMRAVWTLCAAAPVGSYDRQRLLVVDKPLERLRLLELMMANQARDLEDALRRG